MHRDAHFYTTTTYATIGNDETAHDRDRLYVKREKMRAEERYWSWVERHERDAERWARYYGGVVVCLLLAAVGSAIAGSLYAWLHGAG